MTINCTTFEEFMDCIYAAGVAVTEIARRFWSRCPSIGIDDALSQALAVRPKTSPLATA